MFSYLQYFPQFFGGESEGGPESSTRTELLIAIKRNVLLRCILLYSAVHPLRFLFRHEILIKDILLKEVLFWSKRSLFSINWPEHPLTPIKLKHLFPKKLSHMIPVTCCMLYLCNIPLPSIVWFIRKTCYCMLLSLQNFY